MAKKTSSTAKSFAKRIIKASKKRKKIVKKPSKKIAAPKREKKPEKIDYMDFLRNRVQGLEHELRISEELRQEEVDINKKRIEELYTELDHLRERVFGIKTKREKRVEELEEKIKERAKKAEIYKILEMEHQLKKMQEKYEQLKQSMKYPPASLEVTKMAIESLKQKIDAKKREMTSMKIPLTGIRHTMKFEAPSPKTGIPAEEIRPELPSLPKKMPGKPFMKEGRIPNVPPELIKKPKRTFKQKLRIFFLGKPKPKFSKTL
ncbi:hypothetical protein KY343_04990 [Candidatus Woesearchaeota archaeon]|nr:hypothetical protein [Candidatus Woesearchaeota archaeon]